MFKNLTRFNIKRSFIQAVGFYLVYILVPMPLVVLLGYTFAIVVNTFHLIYFRHFDGLLAGDIIAIIYSLVLYFLIMTRKKQNSIGFIMLGVLTGIICACVNYFVSLLIIAFLTTREDKSIDIGSDIPQMSA